MTRSCTPHPSQGPTFARSINSPITSRISLRIPSAASMLRSRYRRNVARMSASASGKTETTKRVIANSGCPSLRPKARAVNSRREAPLGDAGFPRAKRRIWSGRGSLQDSRIMQGQVPSARRSQAQAPLPECDRFERSQKKSSTERRFQRCRAGYGLRRPYGLRSSPPLHARGRASAGRFSRPVRETRRHRAAPATTSMAPNRNDDAPRPWLRGSAGGDCGASWYRDARG